MKKFLLLGGLCCIIFTARANDSAIEGTGGTPAAIGSASKVQPLHGEHPTIRMVRERVAMTVGAQYYDVIADFIFHNDGSARQVWMGFPEGAGGDLDTSKLSRCTAFKRFATWVDGRRVSAQRVPSQQSEEDFEAYWIKPVRFARHQTRHVRVSYRAPLGETTDGQFVYYDFTGGNWKGKVGESLLTLKFTVPGLYRLWPMDEITKSKQWRRGDTLYYRYRNWQAQEGFVLRFMSTLPDALERADDATELKQPNDLYNETRALQIGSATGARLYGAPIYDRPDYILRDGRAFVSLRGFAEGVRYQIERREIRTRQKQRYGSFGWNPVTQSATFTIPGTPDKVLRMAANARTTSLNGNPVPLSAPTFFAGDATNRTLYVPLAPLVTALGGQIQVNTKTRRVWFQIPGLDEV